MKNDVFYIIRKWYCDIYALFYALYKKPLITDSMSQCSQRLMLSSRDRLFLAFASVEEFFFTKKVITILIYYTNYE